ncbi:MAG: DUF4476 domain-containing protein [Hymenobacter sp.]|nr:MAG: DUF4476 domain-containing protein [Hymenobacter sp.]
MKTLCTLAATALLSGAFAAQAAPPLPPANANFASERGLAFGLRLDGQPLTRPLARQVHVDRLAPGQHWADFSLPSPYGPPLRFRTAVWLEPGRETSYVLMLRPGFGPQLRQVAAVPVVGPAYGLVPGYPGGYPPRAPGVPNGGGPGGYYGGQPTTPGNAPYGNPNNGPYGDPSNGPTGGYDGDGTAPAPDQNGSYPSPDGPSNAPYPNNSGGYYPGPTTGGMLYPLPPAEVQDLTQALRNRTLDAERLPLVKQALAQGLVRADELTQLLNTMAFDQSRIELAKYGYGHLSDPQNFYRVYDTLRYPSSIREVQQALGLPQH